MTPQERIERGHEKNEGFLVQSGGQRERDERQDPPSACKQERRTQEKDLDAVVKEPAHGLELWERKDQGHRRQDRREFPDPQIKQGEPQDEKTQEQRKKTQMIDHQMLEAELGRGRRDHPLQPRLGEKAPTGQTLDLLR